MAIFIFATKVDYHLFCTADDTVVSGKQKQAVLTLHEINRQN